MTVRWRAHQSASLTPLTTSPDWSFPTINNSVWWEVLSTHNLRHHHQLRGRPHPLWVCSPIPHHPHVMTCRTDTLGFTMSHRVTCVQNMHRARTSIIWLSSLNQQNIFNQLLTNNNSGSEQVILYIIQLLLSPWDLACKLKHNILQLCVLMKPSTCPNSLKLQCN